MRGSIHHRNVKPNGFQMNDLLHSDFLVGTELAQTLCHDAASEISNINYFTRQTHAEDSNHCSWGSLGNLWRSHGLSELELVPPPGITEFHFAGNIHHHNGRGRFTS